MSEIRLDALGCEAAEAGMGAVLAHWCVGEGERVRAGQPMALLRVQGQTRELAAPHAGVVEQLLVATGERVEPGQAFARLVDL